MIMKNLITNTAVKTAALFSLFLIASGSMFAQSTGSTKDISTNAAPGTNTQTVNAQQSGPWTVGVDPARNTVQLNNSEANPLAVKAVSTRRPFQTRVFVTPTGDGFSSVNMPIPAGTRLVIENQGVFQNIAISNANLKVHVFADERIGTEHYGVGVQARLNGGPVTTAQVQFTFSGYTEDLPATP